MSAPPETEEQRRSVWAKFHAHGFVFAGLAILALFDVFHPRNSQLSRLTGDVPPGQVLYTLGFVISGLLLLRGFLWVDRIAESAAMVLVTVCVVIQTAVAFSMLGWTGFTLTRLIIVAIVGGCTWARCSVLWSREGVVITIPPRSARRGRQT